MIKLKNSLLGTLALVCISLTQVSADVALDGFESTLSPDWAVQNGTVDATSLDAYQGAQSMHLFPQASPVSEVGRNLNLSTGGVAFTDFRIKAAVNGGNVTVDHDGALISFVHNAIDPSLGDVLVLDGDGAGSGVSVDSEKQFVLSGDQAIDWMRVTVRQDFQSQTWDLFLDGELYVANLGFIDPVSGSNNFPLTFFGHETESVNIDEFQMGAVNFLFTDNDKDGMEDSWELLNGLSNTVNDRTNDADGDGLSNINEYKEGKLASVADNNTAGTTYYYADNLNGDDINNGLSAFSARGNGPKESIESVVNAAGNGDIVYLMHGTGSGYVGDGTPISANGGVITIRSADL